MDSGFYVLEMGERDERFASMGELVGRVNELLSQGIKVEQKCNFLAVTGSRVVIFYTV